MNIEETFRRIANEEFDKRSQVASLTPLERFCEEKNLSRTSVWRAEKKGTIQNARTGRKVFVNEAQFKK